MRVEWGGGWAHLKGARAWPRRCETPRETRPLPQPLPQGNLPARVRLNAHAWPVDRCSPRRREREAPRLKLKSFRFVVLYCAPEARRRLKKYLHLYTPHFYDLKELCFYSQLQFTARLSKLLGRCTYKGPWLKRKSEIRRHLLIEKPKENSVSRREWPTDLSAAKRSLGRMEDFTEIKLLDTGSVYFFERDKIKKENVGKEIMWRLLLPFGMHWRSVQRREHSLNNQQKIGLKIYWAWPGPSEQDSDSPMVSLSHQEASIRLLSLLSEGRQTENHHHRKLTNLITWITAFSNSVKLWTMPCRATQYERVMVESSYKTWSPGEWNAKHFTILALRIPWTVWNSKKIGH